MSPGALKKRRNGRPRCIIVAGPNGAGKTTFAREFLPAYARVVHFVNADLIAAGLSPLRPEMAALAAGRLFLKELDRLAGSGRDFAFESTLSGVAYAARLNEWKRIGYRIENRLSEAAESGHWTKPDCRTSPPGRARCARTRCGAAVRAQLGKLPEDLSASGGFVVGL